MVVLAITVNPGHEGFGSSLNDTLGKIVLGLKPSYLCLVNHSDDHFHGLIAVDDGITISKKFCHFEPIRNIKAYRRYMFDHDFVGSIEFGEMPYQENDSIIDYLENNGPVKTVRKFGWLAVRYYKQLKDLYGDMKGNSNGN